MTICHKQLATSQQQLSKLHQQLVDVTSENAKLTVQWQQARDFSHSVSNWFALGILIYNRADNLYTAAYQQRAFNQTQQLLTPKDRQHLARYEDFKKQFSSQDQLITRLKAINHEATAENRRLKRRLIKAASSSGSTVPLVDQVMAKITPAKINSVAWLPAAHWRYHHVLLEDVLINTGNRIFGCFIPHHGGYYFQVVNGRAHQKYRRLGAAKRTLTKNAVYAGIIDGDRVLVTTIFHDITPLQLRSHHELQLHRRRARSNYQALLPADAEIKLTGKKILIVTWQRTQRLNQMLRAFGVEPLIVNNHEKSINWIATTAVSNQIDFTLLLSEGLSHSMLSTLGKETIKTRRDIELVYNESPEELLRRCYRFFSQPT